MAVVIDNHEHADAKAHELLDDRASGARRADDRDPKTAQALDRAFIERLQMRGGEVREDPPCRRRRTKNEDRRRRR